MRELEQLLGVPKSVRERKGMYFQPVTVEAADNFLRGFRVACLASGVCTYEDLQGAEEQRGWKVSATGPIADMRVRGLTEEQIVDELIDIQIAAVNRAVGR